ncbi:MAG: LLM class flavin-dependent oxidoreductase [Halolamina sp.]
MVQFGILLPTRGVVQTSSDRTELTARTHSEVVELATRAEQYGFDGVWVGDSILAKPRLDPFTTLSAVAVATDSVDLGTAVYLPNLRHPISVAHQTATLDQLSGGRLALGVGVGGGPAVRREYDQMGVSFTQRGAILDETLDVVRALWSGKSVDYDGTFVQLSDASISFQPARDPPVYVASKAFDPSEGFPRSIRERIAAHADGWLPSAPFSPDISYSPEMYAAGLEQVRGFVADADRNPEAIDPAYYLDVVVAETERKALDQAREFIETYYTGVDTLTDEQVRQRGVFGPPQQVRERIHEYTEAGVRTLVIRFTAHHQHEQLNRLSRVIN